MLVTSLLALSSLTLPAPIVGDEWSGWRGPGGTGVATEGSPPIEWSEEKNVRWKVAIEGKGNSCPAVFGDLIFVTTAIPTGKVVEKEPEGEPESDGGRAGRGGGRMRMEPAVEQDFVVMALNRADGSVAWKHTARTATPHEGTHRDGSFAVQTPVCDGEHVIFSFGSNGIFAYDMKGEAVWDTDLGDLVIRGSFGEGSSPLLHGDLLIHSWDHEGESFIVGLDKKTGEERWRTERKSATNWSTPVIANDTVVIGGLRTIAYDLKTGAERWAFGEFAAAEAEGEDRGERRPPREGEGEGDQQDQFSVAPQDGGGQRPGGGRGGGRGGRQRSGGIATPVVYEGVLFGSTGDRGRGSFFAIDLETAEGELEEGSEAILWSVEGDTPRIPSMIAYDGILYAMKSSSGILSAFDVTSGDAHYASERMVELSNAYASPVAVDDKLYFTSRDGIFEVIAAGPELKTLAVNELEGTFDASPALAGDEIYLRSLTHVYCIAAE